MQAHTGSGKTLVYSLPILSRIAPSHAAIQAVIVVPTRELGLQVTSVLKKLAAGCPAGKIGIMSVVEGSKNRRYVFSNYFVYHFKVTFTDCGCHTSITHYRYILCTGKYNGQPQNRHISLWATRKPCSAWWTWEGSDYRLWTWWCSTRWTLASSRRRPRRYFAVSRMRLLVFMNTTREY